MKIDIGVGFDQSNKFKAGISGKAGIYLVEGEASLGGSLLGVDGKVKVTGQVGAGFELTGGFIDGKLKVKVGAVALIGGSVEIELDFSHVGETIMGWWEDG